MASSPLSVEEFKRLSLQYAVDNVHDNKYKWLVTQQPDIGNLTDYVTIMIKETTGSFSGDKYTLINLINNSKTYYIEYFTVYGYNNVSKKYDIVHSKIKNMSTNTNHTYKKIPKNSSLEICAVLSSSDKNSGILDIEVSEIIKLSAV